MNKVIGSRIKMFRKKRGMSQKELADRMGISLSYMSQIENGKNNISVSMLTDIAKILMLPTVVMLLEEDPLQDIMTVYAKGRKSYLRNNDSNVTIDMLIATHNKQLEASIVHLPGGSDTKKPQVHRGDEFCFVLKGQVILILEGREEIMMSEGDITAYPADVPHSWRNPGTEESEMLIACTPVTF